MKQKEKVVKKRRKMNPHRRGRKKKSIGIAGLILLFMTFFGAIGGSTEAKKGTGPAAEMQVHFMDVGQGDATLILFGGEAMLIDAGDDSKGTAVQNYLQKQGVTRLKYLVLTHTDADHIGGSDVIISKFPVDNVFIGDFPKENKVYGELMDTLEAQGFPWSTPQVGNTYTLGSARFTILAPNKEYDDPNNCSIALIVENGEDSFLFTGDAEEEAEADILANGLSVDCDVFKAGHHGSKTSNSTVFLETASPKMAVISCGEDNSYGHPHAGPLNTFRSMGVKLYRTDEQGSIVATSTGQGITWNTAPSETWQAGETKGSSGAGNSRKNSRAEEAAEEVTYICNINPSSMKFHYPDCQSVTKMKEENKKPVTCTREEVIAQGFDPCGNCKP